MATREPILEPDLPIIDPHHHLWDRPTEILRNLPPSDHGFMDILREVPRYLLDELLADLKSGHNVRGTVYMECGSFYKASAEPHKNSKKSTRSITQFLGKIHKVLRPPDGKPV